MADSEVLELVKRAESWITRKKGKGLADVQKAILQQVLEGKLLKDVQVSGYSPSTVKQEIAPKLWKLLSEVTQQEVRIRTVRLVLEKLPDSIPTPPPDHEKDTSHQLELPGGQVPLNSVFYVKRPADESDAYDEIGKPGSLIRIKAPKEMGKTSLMRRLLHQAETLGYRSVALNLELAESDVFTSLKKFLRWFCTAVTHSLRLPKALDNYWDEDLGSKVNCTTYFEEYLLPQIGVPLALGLDKVDLIFPHKDVADGFFDLLRVWYEKAKQGDGAIWKNLRQVIVHGTEVYIPISNDRSPFNVGLPIVLSEFNVDQVHDLAGRHGLNLTDIQVNQLMAMMGGHPHLVRLALYKIARQDLSLEQLLEEAPTETGIYDDYLRRLLVSIEKYPELASALKEVVQTDSSVELKSELAFKLESMGLVRLQGNQVTIRNDLYRQYFRVHLKEDAQKGRITVSSPNSNSTIKNILAAILFTDVKDSTRMQHENQELTLSAIFRDLNMMTQLCQQFEGEVLKSMGDGLLMYFVSAVKAVKCAQEIQKTLATAALGMPKEEVLEHRIGIHLAEVYFDGNDVYGDGVNIASRLQSEAEPGGICISSTIYDSVKTHLPLDVTASDRRELKGIGSMLVYQISP